MIAMPEVLPLHPQGAAKKLLYREPLRRDRLASKADDIRFSCHEMKPWLKPLLLGIYVGEPSFFGGF